MAVIAELLAALYATVWAADESSHARALPLSVILNKSHMYLQLVQISSLSNDYFLTKFLIIFFNLMFLKIIFNWR